MDNQQGRLEVVLKPSTTIRQKLLNIAFQNKKNMIKEFKNCIQCNGTSSCLIDPDYVSGLTQADGSFFCLVLNKKRFSSSFRPIFSITQDLGSICVLQKIMCYFQCGSITVNEKKRSAEYIVRSIEQLQLKVFPQFLKYPVHFAKQRSLLILIMIVDNLSNNRKEIDINKKLFVEIAKSSFYMNGRNIEKELKEKNLLIYHSLQNIEADPWDPRIIKYPLTESFIVGLIDGDGCFAVVFESTGKIRFNFHISQDLSQEALLREVMKYLECGTIQYKKEITRFNVIGTKQLREKIIPFMDRNVLHTKKAKHYLLFRKSLLIVYDNFRNLSTERALEIINDVYDSNLLGKRRFLTKDKYLEKCYHLLEKTRRKKVMI
jgi:hypothetical protein